MRSLNALSTQDLGPTFASLRARFAAPAVCFGIRAVLLALLVCCAGTAGATSVAFVGTEVQNTVPGGGVGTSGYIFYEALPHPSGGASVPPSPTPINVTSLPSYVSSITPIASNYYNAPSGTYSSLTIGSTLYDTGLIYATSSQDLVSFTLASTGLPSVIQLGLLNNNYNWNGPGHPTVSMTVTAAGSSSSVTEPIMQSGASDFAVNRFYLFNLTNLTPGDTITISAVAGADGALLGGLTFSPVPEPSSVALMAMSVVGLVGFARFRRRG